MKERQAFRPLVWAVACLALLLLFCPRAAARQTAETARQEEILRVAFPEVRGLSMIDENGVHTGMLVDYLTEIAKYTGWKYEYVDVAEDEDLVKGFVEGKYELMGGTYYNPDFEKYFAYPNYSTGSTKSLLLMRQNDAQAHTYSVGDLKGKTIGVNERATNNIKRLEEFLDRNSIQCTLRRFTREELKGNCISDFLLDGTVDVVLGNTNDVVEGTRTVATIEAQPLYIVAPPGRTDLIEQLNTALGLIYQANPAFAEHCYEKNYPQASYGKAPLSDEEIAYVAAHPTAVVAVPKDFYPFYYKEDGGTPGGLVPDFLAQITEFSGLRFTYLETDTYIESIEALQRGEADLAGVSLDADAQAQQDGLALTLPYGSLSNFVVRRKSVSYPAEGLTCITLEGRALPGHIVAEKVISCTSVYEGLSMLNQGKADIMYGLSAQMESQLQRNNFVNLAPVTLLDEMLDTCFVMPLPAEPELLTLFNKTINNMSEEERTKIVQANMISPGVRNGSLIELIYGYPIYFVAAITVLLLILLLFLYFTYRARLHSLNLQAEVARAEADAHAKSEFLSRMSHEMRTPMNAIVGLAEVVMLQPEVPPTVRENLQKLRFSCHYLLDLINDVLDMNRIDSGMFTVAQEPFSLTLMAENIEAMFAPQAGKKGQTLQFEVAVRHPGVTGDAIRLRQVLTNLIGNSLKFCGPNGHIRVFVQEEDSGDAAATFFFEVSDDGPGVAPEAQERIFKPFEQTGSSSARSQGTGLGLPISANIVRLMGGNLQLSSAVGKGSCFYFTLTLPYGALPPTPEPCSPGTERLRGAHYLLAEDNEINAEIAESLLTMQGAKVTPVATGRAAVDAFAASAPGTYDAILMDIRMPEMDGLEATRAIRALARPDAAAIPIIAMTANTFQQDIEAAKAAGMNDFLPKPVDVQKLYQTLGRYRR